MNHLYQLFASYVRRNRINGSFLVLCKPRLIFSRINGPSMYKLIKGAFICKLQPLFLLVISFDCFFLKLKNNKTFHRRNKPQLVKIKYSFFFVMFEVISSLVLHCASDTAHNIATSKEADIFAGRQKS